MCIHLFAPNHKLEIEYASESITLTGGAIESIIDLLLVNCSDRPVERIHLVYPYAMGLSDISTFHPSETHQRPADGTVRRIAERARKAARRPGALKPFIGDVSDTWVEEESSYNKFYDNIERVQLEDGYSVTVQITDPNHELRRYVGMVRGKQDMVPYERSEGTRLTITEWQLLSHLGWTVCTTVFSEPIAPGEKRWLRFVAFSGRLQRNVFSPVEQFARKSAAVLTHVFEIAGPEDVRYRISRDLHRDLDGEALTSVQRFKKMELQALRDAILRRGIEAPGTETVVQDWRINLFERGYREMDEPSAQGAIEACSPLVKTVRLFKNGRPIEVYQWKAGLRNVAVRNGGSGFQIRVRAKDTPFSALLLGPISLVVAIVGLIIALLAWRGC